MPELTAIVAKKLKLKSLDPGQRVYFLLTGMLIDPEQYEQKLWDFVGESWQRIQHISDFLGDHHLPDQDGQWLWLWLYPLVARNGATKADLSDVHILVGETVKPTR